MSTDDRTDDVGTGRPGSATDLADEPEPRTGGGTAVWALVTALVAAALTWVQTVDPDAGVLAGVVAVIALALGAVALGDAVRGGRRGGALAVAALVVALVGLGLVLATQGGLIGAGRERADRSTAAGDDTDDRSDDDATPTAPPVRTTTTFDEPFSYDDGLAFTITPPVPFEPSESADAAENGEHVRVTVVIYNGTGEPWDPVLFRADAAAGGVSATPVFDSAQNLLGAPPPEPLAPDGGLVFDLGFTVSDPDAMVVTVNGGGIGHEDVTVGAG